MSVWTRIRQKVREVGPAYALERAVARVVPRRWFAFMDALVYELRPELIGSYHPGDHPIRWLTGQDSDPNLEGLYGQSLAGRLASGSRAAIVRGEGSIEGILWVEGSGYLESDWIRVELPEQERWISYAWVSPRQRGRGLSPALNHFVITELAEAGARRLLTRVDRRNQNSRRAIGKVGARRLGSLFAVRILSFNFFKASGGRMQLGWGFRKTFTIRSDQFPDEPPPGPPGRIGATP